MQARKAGLERTHSSSDLEKFSELEIDYKLKQKSDIAEEDQNRRSEDLVRGMKRDEKRLERLRETLIKKSRDDYCWNMTNKRGVMDAKIEDWTTRCEGNLQKLPPPPLLTLEDANTSQGTMDSGKPVEGETERLEAEARDSPIQKYKDNLAKEKSKLEENKQRLDKLKEGLDYTERRFDYLKQGILGRIGVKKAAQQRNAGNQVSRS